MDLDDQIHASSSVENRTRPNQQNSLLTSDKVYFLYLIFFIIIYLRTQKKDLVTEFCIKIIGKTSEIRLHTWSKICHRFQKEILRKNKSYQNWPNLLITPSNKDISDFELFCFS